MSQKDFYTIGKHFILTRFNLKNFIEDERKDRNGNPVLSDDWMDARMKLFKMYCLPSVLNQSCKNFTWVIYIDSGTKKKYKNEFQQLTRDFSFIVIKESSSYEQFLQKHPSDLLELKPKDCQYIITTRLDNDDLIHRQFVEIVQSKFDYQSYIAINFTEVYILNPLDKNRLHVDFQFSNHFVSLIEKISDAGIKGCYSKDDRFWDVKGEVRQITEGPYCAEIISDRNLVNDYRGFPVLKKQDLSEFSLAGDFSNKWYSKSTFQIWKMSWFKAYRYYKLRLMEKKK